MSPLNRQSTKKGGDDGTPFRTLLLNAGKGDKGVLGASSAGTVFQNTVVTERREAEQTLMKKFYSLRVRHQHPIPLESSGNPSEASPSTSPSVISTDVLASFKKSRRTPLGITLPMSTNTFVSRYQITSLRLKYLKTSYRTFFHKATVTASSTLQRTHNTYLGLN